MGRRRTREEKPAASNRGRTGAKGVFVIFEQDEEAEQSREPTPESPPEDEPIARDDGDAA